MASPLIDLRDETYTRLLAKRVAAEFSFNNFGLKKTWKPSVDIETMNLPLASGGFREGGLVTVVGGVMGDRVALDRESVTLADYSVMIGYQKYISQEITNDATAAIDALVNFVDELEEMCRQDVTLDNFSWSRTEFLKDEQGLPFHFVRIAEDSTFEAYFNAYFIKVLP